VYQLHYFLALLTIILSLFLMSSGERNIGKFVASENRTSLIVGRSESTLDLPNSSSPKPEIWRFPELIQGTPRKTIFMEDHDDGDDRRPGHGEAWIRKRVNPGAFGRVFVETKDAGEFRAVQQDLPCS
jgi:hypothetical protein